MDYILKQSREQIDASMQLHQHHRTIESCRNGIEYAMIFMLAYMWNKNIHRVSHDTRLSLTDKIRRPTIGTIIEMCRSLDIDAEFFGTDQRTIAAANSYPSLRNSRIGHGYLLDDGNVRETARSLDDILYEMTTGDTIVASQFDLVFVLGHKSDHDIYIGHTFKADGTMRAWQASGDILRFRTNNVYARELGTHQYHRLSPFVVVEDTDFFFFANIVDTMSGRAKYNQALRTQTIYREWPDFTDDISNDGVRRISVNGTISNVYDNNYKQYIDLDVGAKSEILSFLDSQASVCAIVWGHGGVGKTSTVQSVCDDLSRQKRRKYDYIVFASAKNRTFDYRKGEIRQMKGAIDSYGDLLDVVATTLSVDRDVHGIEDAIRNFDGSLLLIIDDYETFREADRQSINGFIRSLDVDHNKVVVTTRANVNVQIGGLEVRTNELTKARASDFLVRVMEAEFGGDISRLRRELSEESLDERVFVATGGRPLFILYLAHVWAETGSLSEAAGQEIRTHDDAIEFLFGRVYECLSREGKRLFGAISCLVTPNELENLTEKLRFIVNMNSEQFHQGLQDLLKLRIVERFENGFFRVYSAELVGIMGRAFERSPRGERGSVLARLRKVTGRTDIDTERALLDNANRARHSREEIEVVELYHEILNRESSSDEIRLSALMNLSEYLFNLRDRKDQAILTLERYQGRYGNNPSFTKVLSNYYWSTDRRRDAINVVGDYVSRRGSREREGIGIRCEFLGLALMYESIYLSHRADELEVKPRFREIDQKTLIDREHDIARDLKRIRDKRVTLLLRLVKEIGLNELESGTRQNVVAGLDRFSAACVKVGVYKDLSLSICKYVTGERVPYLKESFERRIKSILEDRKADQKLTLMPGDRFVS